MSHAKGFETLDNQIAVDDLPVEGRVPTWLTGQLLRTGPARFEVGEDAYNHWFDGLAMLHGFGFADGRVSYANRFLESDAYTEAERAGSIVRPEFGTDPCVSIFKRAMQIFSPPEATDNASVNIARLADEYVALTETPIPVVFDNETLETVDHFDFDDGLEGDMTTAHPHVDFERGETYNYVTKFGSTCSYNVYRQPRESRNRRLVASIDVGKPRYMHSFAMTENYVVLTEFPLTLDPLELLVSDGPFAELMRWEPEHGTRFQVIDKRTGEVTGKATTEAFFSFHHVNAWENAEGELVVDLAAYPDADLIERLYLDELRRAEPGLDGGRLQRFRLGPDGSDLRGETLSEENIELPRINYEAHNGRRYRYVWGTGGRDDSDFLDEIVRIDTNDGSSETWREPNTYPGEPVFVARPDARAEDDGVLLSVVLDGDASRSFLLILDAATLEEVGRAAVPHHIPFGFHGAYFED